eukprot:gene32051-58018_t
MSRRYGQEKDGLVARLRPVVKKSEKATEFLRMDLISKE